MSNSPDNLLLATDLAAWDRLVVALSRRDVPHLLQLLATGDIVPVPAGSAFIIDEDLATLARIRVLDGPAAGASGLVTSRSLQSTNQAA